MTKLMDFKMPWHQNIVRLWANTRNKPWIWVDMDHLTIDNLGMLEVRYEYNDAMVDHLRRLNYNGDTHDEIVQKYIERCYLRVADEDDPDKLFEGLPLEDGVDDIDE